MNSSKETISPDLVSWSNSIVEILGDRFFLALTSSGRSFNSFSTLNWRPNPTDGSVKEVTALKGIKIFFFSQLKDNVISKWSSVVF